MNDDAFAGLPRAFADFLDDRGLVYDPLTQVDLLASALGSQFVVFAGPSGTGKSTAARVLADFFASPSSVIDVRPGWASVEDLVGQYSVFAREFLPGAGHAALERLSRQNSEAAPVLILEEANLSPLESYLGPLVTAASGLAFESFAVDSSTSPSGFGRIEIGGWPRFFATVNIDSTAPAPAPKVSGRACVVLLEPPGVELLLQAAQDADDLAGAPQHRESGGILLGDPRAGIDAARVAGGRDLRWVTEALRPLVELLAEHAGSGMNVVSPRDVLRARSYMEWHRALSSGAARDGHLLGYSEAESAENALLHFVLPGLTAEQFGRAAAPLAASATEDGLLRGRLDKLLNGADNLFGVTPDFWASLS
ncbi:ATP-binding protein [Cellulomonas endometrii]|uniref:ATP-binding protein n=1 Tax=Cellulomonas endometrii TaxID=3036301 RepID=UPI0024AE7DAF|nr:ATP-binding protein [Cellulomonas endometrii]